ncbi:MAG TPA: ribonuclease III domain-containing protein [Bacillota bacterium]|nr:ribonuclease III domain-containing protein [Bacillota bacterium]
MEKNLTREEVIRLYSSATLAYIGDAVIEVIVRTYLTYEGDKSVSRLNDEAKSFVTAACQSAAAGKLDSILDEFEMSVYKRGRNMKTLHAPKNTTLIDYRRATGLECVFGYLWLLKDSERIQQLFRFCFLERNES